MNWNEFIEFSEALALNFYPTKVSKECVYRVIISRSYYGIFKQIQDYLIKKNITLPEKYNDGNKITGEHEKVIEFLKTHSDKNIQTIGNQLKFLRNHRIAADYFLSQSQYRNIVINASSANNVIYCAKKYIDLWNKEKIKVI